MKASYKVQNEKFKVGVPFTDIPDNHLCVVEGGKYDDLRYIKIPEFFVVNDKVNAIELENSNSLTRVYRPCLIQKGSNLRYIDLGPVISVEVTVKL